MIDNSGMRNLVIPQHQKLLVENSGEINLNVIDNGHITLNQNMDNSGEVNLNPNDPKISLVTQLDDKGYQTLEIDNSGMMNISVPYDTQMQIEDNSGEVEFNNSSHSIIPSDNSNNSVTITDSDNDIDIDDDGTDSNHIIINGHDYSSDINNDMHKDNIISISIHSHNGHTAKTITTKDQNGNINTKTITNYHHKHNPHSMNGLLANFFHKLL